ncbi:MULTISPECIES: hypothetical protein [Leptospira]|nr:MULTISPECIES: hypothetical protein [Leptospira]MCL8265731.1 hypothetical protein [Leptospira weilii]MDL5245497.1 hypothetical protein [Leptospira weilii]ULH26924.1 hypothetical protein FH586_01555 [Leptospira weilii]
MEDHSDKIWRFETDTKIRFKRKLQNKPGFTGLFYILNKKELFEMSLIF